MADTDPNELVDIYNPKLHPGADPPTAVATRQAFDEVWKDKGFRLYTDQAAPTSTTKTGS